MESLYDELKLKATKIRRNIVNMIYLASSGHPGGALSITDILTVCYLTEKNIAYFVIFFLKIFFILLSDIGSNNPFKISMGITFFFFEYFIFLAGF